MKPNTDDQLTLEQDATLDESLRRVAYEAGMMLGLEATRDEQAYHRRRLTRHQYWLHGFGTLAGMAVSKDPASHTNSSDPMAVRLVVGPGLGFDSFGREVLVHEPYCIELGQWLAAQEMTALLEGYSEDDDLLWFKVTVRHQDCPVAAQPVLARKLNLSTDAVQPSRTADSVLLELIPELPPATEDGRFRPWAVHAPLPETMPSLTAAETATLDAVPEGAERNLLALHARQLHALDTGGVSVQDLADAYADNARILLARISIQAPDINDIVVNPERISINNLVRPFLVSASQLAWLLGQP